MYFEPELFYQSYISKYHKYKATYLNKMIAGLEENYLKEFFGEDTSDEDRDSIRRTLKSELRQNYFHAIESFFELLFALNPDGKESFDDKNILFNITNSNWQKNYAFINRIAENPEILNFLDKKINFQGHHVTVGHYLFYMGIFNNKEFIKDILESIGAIKYGITILAKDFSDRTEYNSYKHGLRIVPMFSKVTFVDPKTVKPLMNVNLEDSMSFYTKGSKKDELSVVTKIQNHERDYKMTLFCSELIYSLINFRRLSLKFEKDVKANLPVEVPIFGKDVIEKSNSINKGIVQIKTTVKISTPHKKS